MMADEKLIDYESIAHHVFENVEFDSTYDDLWYCFRNVPDVEAQAHWYAMTIYDLLRRRDNYARLFASYGMDAASKFYHLMLAGRAIVGRRPPARVEDTGEMITDPDQLTDEYAVYLMEDWSGGQFDMLEGAPLSHMRVYYAAAKRTLAQEIIPVTEWAKYVARRLIDEIPQELEAQQAREMRQREKLMPMPHKGGAGYVYLLQSTTGAYKIGRSINPHNRLKTFEVKLPFEVEYVCVIATDSMVALEAALHGRFADKRVNGEWFALTPDDVEYIKGLAQ